MYVPSHVRMNWRGEESVSAFANTWPVPGAYMGSGFRSAPSAATKSSVNWGKPAGVLNARNPFAHTHALLYRIP